MRYHTFATRGRYIENIRSLFIIIFYKCVLSCVSDGTPTATRLWMNGFPTRPDDKQSTLSRYVQWHHTLRIFLHKLLSNEVWKCFTIRVHKFYKKIWKPSPNSPHQKVYMNLVSDWGPTNLSGHRTKFSCQGDLAFRICAPLSVTLHWPRCSLCFYWSQEDFVWNIWDADADESYITEFSVCLVSYTCTDVLEQPQCTSF